VSYGHHRQFLDGSVGGFMRKSSFLEYDMVAGVFGVEVQTLIACLS
jgi:hypothetical protein